MSLDALASERHMLYKKPRASYIFHGRAVEGTRPVTSVFDHKGTKRNNFRS